MTATARTGIKIQYNTNLNKALTTVVRKALTCFTSFPVRLGRRGVFRLHNDAQHDLTRLVIDVHHPRNARIAVGQAHAELGGLRRGVGYIFTACSVLQYRHVQPAQYPSAHRFGNCVFLQTGHVAIARRVAVAILARCGIVNIIRSS